MENTRSIGILGAGAMGTLFAARLARVGLDVTLVDVNDELLQALRRDGARCHTDEALSQEPLPGTPAQMRDYWRSESRSWGQVIESAGIRLD